MDNLVFQFSDMFGKFSGIHKYEFTCVTAVVLVYFFESCFCDPKLQFTVVAQISYDACE